MARRVAIIGFGEAGLGFALAAGWGAAASAYDLKTEEAETRAAKLADFARAGVAGAATVAEALSGAPVVLSLVAADAAEDAAKLAAPHLAPGALFVDMNSVSASAKQRAAAAVEAAGARYADGAIMAPVEPARLAVPLRVAGPHGAATIAALSTLGFTGAALGGDRVGDAATVKLLRSVIIKGLEALTAEAWLGAEAAGLTGALIDALGEDWRTRAPYNLERMATHGLRRAAEMEEAALTLRELGVEPLMTRGTIARQRALGRATPHDQPRRLSRALAAE